MEFYWWCEQCGLEFETHKKLKENEDDTSKEKEERDVCPYCHGDRYIRKYCDWRRLETRVQEYVA